MKTTSIDLEIGIEVDYVLFPAQHGGTDEPSWDRYVEIEGLKLNGEEIYLDDKTMKKISEMILKEETE